MRTLEEIRKEIEEIDREIIDLIARRTHLAREIVEAKKREGVRIEVEDEEQKRKVIGRAIKMANERNLDPSGIKEIFEILTRMNWEQQKMLLGEVNSF
ncbi:MAG: chorismate mutase [Archaeoglobi archaeon]|nr:chorismate mutase [Candidatus Mnemosynella bozhongmuii]MDI3502049.1 chorismate mutase [Archaeoglobi archaeon]MDK2781307.1 chorismate mutase [Archaeoglobi archaeon]